MSKEIVLNVLDRLDKLPCFSEFSIRKRDYSLVKKTEFGYYRLTLANRDSYDLKRNCRAREITPTYRVRFDCLHKWFKKFCVRSKADQSGESTVGFNGKMLKGKYDFYFRLDGVDFEEDYDSLKNEVIKQSSYVFENYGTLQKMHESIIIPILNGQKKLFTCGAEWAFEYLKLCHIVAPQDYNALKSIIIKHIEFLNSIGEPNIANYYPILDSILKDIEES